MSTDSVDKTPQVRKVADRLLAAIEAADSMLQGVKTGARAEGFVLGLETAGALPPEELEALYLLFEEATERRLREVAGAK